MRAKSLPVLLVLRSLMAVTARGGAKLPPSQVGVELLRVPDGGFQPQAQVDAKGRVHLIYAKGDPQRCDVFYVRSGDAGKTFSSPLRVNDRPGSAIAVGTVRGAQLAVGREGRV